MSVPINVLHPRARATQPSKKSVIHIAVYNKAADTLCVVSFIEATNRGTHAYAAIIRAMVMIVAIEKRVDCCIGSEKQVCTMYIS